VCKTAIKPLTLQYYCSFDCKAYDVWCHRKRKWPCYSELCS